MLEFNRDQVENLLKMFGENGTKITVTKDDDELLAYDSDCPEQGSMEL